MVSRYKIGEEDERPWGHWQVLDVGGNFTVKRITVKSGARLSLQYHNHRQEVWTCVEGTGLALVENEEIELKRGVTVEIPLKAKHRMIGIGEKPMVVIETQYGDVLDEDDIVRIEDDFGR